MALLPSALAVAFTFQSSIAFTMIATYVDAAVTDVVVAGKIPTVTRVVLPVRTIAMKPSIIRSLLTPSDANAALIAWNILPLRSASATLTLNTNVTVPALAMLISGNMVPVDEDDEEDSTPVLVDDDTLLELESVEVLDDPDEEDDDDDDESVVLVDDDDVDDASVVLVDDDDDDDDDASVVLVDDDSPVLLELDELDELDDSPVDEDDTPVEDSPVDDEDDTAGKTTSITNELRLASLIVTVSTTLPAVNVKVNSCDEIIAGVNVVIDAVPVCDNDNEYADDKV